MTDSDRSGRAPTIGILLLIPVLLLAIACATQGLAQSPDPTAAPEVTEAPQVTEPPATDPPAADATQPADGAAAPADSGSDSAADSGSDSDIPTWGWILIAGGVGILIVVLVALSQRGRRDAVATKSQWHATALDAYASSAAIHDIVSANLNADGLGGASGDWERRWEGVRRRINDLVADFHSLEARTSDSEASALVQELIAGLAALRSAVEAHLYLRSRDDAAELTDEQIAESESLVKERLSQFDASLTGFKAWVDQNR